MTVKNGSGREMGMALRGGEGEEKVRRNEDITGLD
jgi:hypothetical protein